MTFKLTIPTMPLNQADDYNPGTALAEVLRAVADRVEREINIVPGNDPEWITETYHHPFRSTSGVLLDAVYELIGG